MAEFFAGLRDDGILRDFGILRAMPAFFFSRSRGLVVSRSRGSGALPRHSQAFPVFLSHSQSIARPRRIAPPPSRRPANRKKSRLILHSQTIFIYLSIISINKG